MIDPVFGWPDGEGPAAIPELGDGTTIGEALVAGRRAHVAGLAEDADWLYLLARNGGDWAAARKLGDQTAQNGAQNATGATESAEQGAVGVPGHLKPSESLSEPPRGVR